jgi:hypothetical protein
MKPFPRYGDRAVRQQMQVSPVHKFVAEARAVTSMTQSVWL